MSYATKIKLVIILAYALIGCVAILFALYLVKFSGYDKPTVTITVQVFQVFVILYFNRLIDRFIRKRIHGET